MQPLLDAQLRRQLHERFRAAAWMGPVGNLAAALVWVTAIAGSGASRSTVLVWSVAMILACTAMAAAYVVPASFRWTDPAGVPYLTLGSLCATGLLWGSTLWLDGAQAAPDKYVYGTIAVMLGLVSGSMVATSGVARVTGALLVPMALAGVAALLRDGLWAEACGLTFLAALITPVQIDSAAGIRELLLLRLASEEAACRDPLTGLLNRRGLSEALGRVAPRQPVTVLFADIDRFKEVNDAHGHETGDEVLCLIGARLEADLPDSAIVSRFGGDEFVAVVSNASVTPREVSRRVRTTIEIDPSSGGEPFVVSMSLGLAEGRAADVESTLLTQADRRMFVAKRSRRTRRRDIRETLDLVADDRAPVLASGERAGRQVPTVFPTTSPAVSE